eukprot:m.715050 g.715050  ORF g.715050 m.715050 type:complete len:185 (+) comp22975_c1_seq4:268-822(+)
MSYLGASVAVTTHQTFPDAPEIPAAATPAGACIRALLDRKRVFVSMSEKIRPAKLRKECTGGAVDNSQETFEWDLEWTSGVLDDLKTPKRKQVRKLSKEEMTKRVIKSLKAAGDDDDADDDNAVGEGDPAVRKGDGEGNDEDEDEVAADDEEDEEEPVDYTDSYFDNGEEDEFNPADDNDKDDY